MSANDDRGQEDTADLKDIDKILKKLVESLERLNEKLDKNSKAFSANRDLVAEHSEQTKKNKLEIQASYFENLKEMAEFRKSLKESGGQFNFLTGLLKNGTSAVSVIGAITKKLDGMGSSFDELKRATKEVADFEDTIRQRMKDQNRTGKPEDNKDLLTDAERKQMGRAESSKDENKGADSKTNQFMSFGKEFFKKHAAGIAIGAAGAGTILKVLKMAFDASPMFQQVKKLLQFGVMMVLRPIGDFFGFLFRPIMIMLLRKFIIPWYTKLMPVMIHMGQLIGEKLSGAFEALAEGDVAKAFALLFADVDFKAILGDALQGFKDWIHNTDWNQVAVDITNTLMEIGKGLWIYILEPIGTWLYEELSKIDWGAAIWDTIKAVVPVFRVEDFIAGIFGIGNNKWWNEMGRGFSDWVTEGLASITQDWGKIWDMIVDWLNPFSANKWGGGDDGNSNTSSGTSFFEDPLGGLTDIWDSMTGGGDTNNNQEINININATGGNSELANDIGRQVGIEVQEIQRQGSPR
tara:strand:- start:1346 stop:2908 length:1563 start_codon:yes stop_codon:yes gene_type:complete